MTGAWFALANILIDGAGQAWATYRLPTVSYPLQTQQRKRALLEQLAAVAAGAKADLTLWRLAATPNSPEVVVLLAIKLANERGKSPAAWLATQLRVADR